MSRRRGVYDHERGGYQTERPAYQITVTRAQLDTIRGWALLAVLCLAAWLGYATGHHTTEQDVRVVARCQVLDLRAGMDPC